MRPQALLPLGRPGRLRQSAACAMTGPGAHWQICDRLLRRTYISDIQVPGSVINRVTRYATLSRSIEGGVAHEVRPPRGPGFVPGDRRGPRLRGAAFVL